MDVLVVVIYCRVSTEEQGKRGFSLPEQQRQCRQKAAELAGNRGADLQVAEFQDTASGEVIDRAGLTAMRDFISRNHADVFVCLDPDRFARSLSLQLLVADEIEQKGIQLVFVQHQYDTSPEGRLFFQIRGSISEFEKAKIKERSRRGRLGKLNAGGIPNHIATWGYRWSTSSKTLAIDEEAAPWVRQVFAWYADGWSYQRIADELDRLGVSPPRAEHWHRTSLMRVLRNSTYVGRLMLNRWDCEGNGPLKSIPKEKRPRARTDRRRPPEEWVEVRVPAIISAGLWERVRAAHERRSRQASRGVGLLSGLCRCGLCGGNVHQVGDARHRYLRCQNRYPHLLDRRRRPERPCPWSDLRSAGVEGAIWQYVQRWLTDPDALRGELERQRAQRRAAPDPALDRLRLLERALAERREEQQRVYKLFLKGIAPATAEADLGRLAGQVRALEDEVQRAQAKVEAGPAHVPAVTMDLTGMQSEVLARLAALGLKARQTLVRMLIEQVTVWPDGRFEHTALRIPR